MRASREGAIKMMEQELNPNNKESACGRGNTPAGFQVGVSVSGKQTVTTSEMTLDTAVSSALRLIGHKGTVSICRSCLSSAHFLSRK